MQNCNNKNRLSFCFLVIFCLVLSSTFAQDIIHIDDSQSNADALEEEKERGKGATGRTGVFTLGEIVVKAESLADIEDASTTTRITQKDIRAHSDKTLDDALKAIPGIIVERHRKGHVRTRIRGFDQDKIAILVDGIPIRDVYSTDIDISQISVMNISRIIVNRGVSSALYGSRGAIGSINVISKRPSRVFAECNAEYGQINNYTLNVAQGAPMGDFYYWLTGSMMNSDGFKPSAELDSLKRREWFHKLIPYYLYGYSFEELNIPAKEDYILDERKWDHFNYHKYNFSGKAGYSFSSQFEAGLSFRYNYYTGKTNTYQHYCFSDYKSDDLYWNDPVFVISDIKDVKKAALRNRSFEWPGVFDYRVSPYFHIKYSDFTVKANAFYSHRMSEQEGYASTDHDYVKDTSVAGNFMEPFRDIKTYKTYGFNIYPSYRIANWNRVSIAILWNNDSYKGEEQALSSAAPAPNISQYLGLEKFPVKYLESSYLSLAIEDEISIRKRLSITAGISYDSHHFSKYKNRIGIYEYGDAYILKDDSMFWGTRDSFNPVAGITYEVMKNLLLLRMSGSIKTRFPTLSEYSKVLDAMHDDYLKPERSYNSNTGFELFVLDKTLSFRIDYFASIITNRIEKIAGGDEPPINIERIISQGVENLLSYEKDDILDIFDLNMQISYTYIHARSRDDSHDEKANKGKLLELTPEHQMTADLRLNFKSNTSINLRGYATFNQVMYTMKYRPEPEVTTPPLVTYSTDYFKSVKVHDPVILNIRISQKIYEYYELYILCRNILDDYNADPFNPGPGRMFYLGGSARL
ncbi:MAG: TonB-dependent receptor plug domain-containing protein [Spirochaetota bacterium]|nr:TonB-dependent receptor plug domain-containing protein [Spirochaetota bacterium]